MSLIDNAPGVLTEDKKYRQLLIYLGDPSVSLIYDFCFSDKTGQITLNVKDGKVQAIDIRETVRVSS